MIMLLGIFDILAAIFCIFQFNATLSLFFASALMLKGVYTIIMTANLFDPLGLIDVVAGGAFFLGMMGLSTGFFLNFIFIIILLKGVSSFIRL